jgi:hypothetical protein
VSHAFSGRSLPVTQWTGASKWVPVCSPKRSVFQALVEGRLTIVDLTLPLGPPHHARARHAGSRRDGGDIAAGGGCGRESANRQQALVVEHDVHQIARPVAGEGGEAAKIHEDRAVAVEHDDLAIGARQRDSEAHGRGEAHGMLQVKEVRPVADRRSSAATAPMMVTTGTPSSWA